MEGIGYCSPEVVHTGIYGGSMIDCGGKGSRGRKHTHTSCEEVVGWTAADWVPCLCRNTCTASRYTLVTQQLANIAKAKYGICYYYKGNSSETKSKPGV